MIEVLNMDELTSLFKIFSDETRMRIMMLLYHQDLCVCQLQGIMKESQPKVSKNLAKLRDVGLVIDERREQFVFYSLDRNNVLLKELLQIIILKIQENVDTQSDLERLQFASIYINRA